MNVFLVAGYCGLSEHMVTIGDVVVRRPDVTRSDIATIINHGSRRPDLFGKVEEWISISLTKVKKGYVWFRVAKFAAVAGKVELFKEGVQWRANPISALESEALFECVAASSNDETLNELMKTGLLPKDRRLGSSLESNTTVTTSVC